MKTEAPNENIDIEEEESLVILIDSIKKILNKDYYGSSRIR